MKKKKLKNTILYYGLIGFIIFYLFATYFIMSGTTKNPNVKLDDFNVSEDGTEITLILDNSNPANSVRTFTPMPNENAIFMDFYYAFGFGKHVFGAKDQFVIQVDENCYAILFARNNDYELVLAKNIKTGQWEIPVATEEK